jgi:hypothetical protein
MPDGAVALEGDPHRGEPTNRRVLDDPVLHQPVLRDGLPIPAN